MTITAPDPTTTSPSTSTVRPALPSTLQHVLNIALGTSHSPIDAEVDWDEFISLTHLHGLLPLVHRNLSASQAPPHVRMQIAQLVLAGTAKNLKLADCLVRTIDILHQHQIRMLTVKGPHLALTLHGDLKSRMFSDIDLFVDRADIPTAHVALTACGYRLMNQPVLPSQAEFTRFLNCTQDKDYVYQCPDGSTLELHWALQRPGLGTILGFEAAWKDRRTVSYRENDIPGLGNVHQVVYLAAHGTAHRWRRLEWLYSLSQMASRLTSSEWESVQELAKKRRMTSILNLTLSLATELGFDAGEYALAQTERPRLVGEIVEVLSRLDVKEEYHQDTAFYIAAKRDAGDRISAWWRRLTMPSHRDLAALPVSLRRWPFYCMIRPARLALVGISPCRPSSPSRE